MTTIYITDPNGFKVFASGDSKEYPVILINDGPEHEIRMLLKTYVQLEELAVTIGNALEEYRNSELKDVEEALR